MIKLEHSDRRHQALMMVANGHVGCVWHGRSWEWRVMGYSSTKSTAEALQELLEADAIRLESTATAKPGRVILSDWFPAVMAETGEDVLNAWSRKHPTTKPPHDFH